jgi:ribonuclease HI
VISVLSYTGAWTSPTKAVISQWRNAVERTVLGKIVPGRSRYLAWVTALSPFLDPQYALDDRAIKHEKWLVRRQAAGLTADGQASRLDDVLERWAWTRTACGVFNTSEGQLHLGFDGKATIKHVMRQGWERSLWHDEPRASDAATRQLDTTRRPEVGSHRAWIAALPAICGPRAQVALGAGMDARIIQRMADGPVTCMCGIAEPTRRHLTWQCPSRRLPVLRAPLCGAEEGLLVPMVSKPSRPPTRQQGHPGALEAELRRLWANTATPPLCATDGSSVGRSLEERVAGFGAAAGDCAVQGPVPGLDQTAPGSEMHAIIQAVRAARAAMVPCIFVIDNKMVVAGTQAAIQGRRPGGEDFSAAWAHLRELFSQLPGCQAHWCPSHGKSEDWQPPHGHSAVVWRAINDKADVAAGQASEECLRVRRRTLQSSQQGKVWAQRALEVQLEQLEALHVRSGLRAQANEA